MSKENLKEMDRSSSQESLETQEVVFEKTPIQGPVGFDSITKQIEAKSLKRGFDFNILVTGQTGLGKSTFVNTLFTAHLVDAKSSKTPSDTPRKTTDITTRSHLVEEKGVKLRLTLIDTPGFAEQLNNDKCWEPIVQYIQQQYRVYQKEEAAIVRKKIIRDSRVHVCLYFIAPNGLALKPVDIESMKNLCEFVNLVPVIAKSDTLTLEEREEFKKRINEEIKFHKIKIYPTDYLEYDAEELAANKAISALIPFAVVGSEKTITVDGKSFPGRKLGWGVINVEDPQHCEFSHLRKFLISTHLQDLIETTKFVHYETYRRISLETKKERKEKKKSSKNKD